ncbi:MAG: TPM domain-containing protein [Cellulosilyticaceae bacterium]
MRSSRQTSYVRSLVILFILCTSLSICAFITLPTPTSQHYVHDYVGILTTDEVTHIRSIGYELEQATGAQAVTVIIPSTDGIPIETYALQLFRSWGIGQKHKDNGLLMLVSIQDRQWRVEVGRGLEGAIPDALSARIMTTYSQPYFSEGAYGQGVLASYSVLADTVAQEYGITLTHSLNIPPLSTATSHRSNIWLLLIALIVADLILNRGRIFSTLWQVAFWSNIGRGPRGPRGGGYGGGGYSGFGGGSSNGGGSSGSW